MGYFYYLEDVALKMLIHLKNKINPKQITGFLIHPDSIMITVGKNHMVLEYYGPEKINEIKDSNRIEVNFRDYSKEDLTEQEFFSKVIGIKSDSTLDFPMALPVVNEDLIVPTNEGIDKLVELGWNFAAQDNITFINTPQPYVPKGQFCRLINSMFFDANEGGLVTRRVKWMDFIPLEMDEESSEDRDFFTIDLGIYSRNWLNDLKYQFPMPEGFKGEKLQLVNKFIEIYGTKNNTEPQITNYLSNEENKFILTMYFCGKQIYSQLKCEWQSEEKDAIIPDFFVEKPNGYADIVEFKLPYLKGNSIVGTNNRERASAELSAYIAQTRVYKNYFEDPNNREWVKNTYGIKVYNPKRYIVVGRRYEFDIDEWQEIQSEYTDVEIITYDDLIDGVISQFYL